ncbi:MAG TPA: hypothetical protein PLL99_05860 [Chitinophagales bacterium]|nr:hypothetical protein [Chitinophagales bacterium]
MFAQDCIDSSIPFIRLTDEVGFVLDLMQEFKTNRLAVIDNSHFMGCIAEDTLLEHDDLTKIEQLKEHFLSDKIIEGTHVFDILKMEADCAIYFLPIVALNEEYIGMITPQKLLHNLTQISSLTNSGGIIVLELESRNYSLTEISKIVESNNAIILHSMVTASAEQALIQVSLKINKNDLKEIQASFERYQYTVLAVLHQSEFEQQLQERYDSLMRYLEV